MASWLTDQAARRLFRLGLVFGGIGGVVLLVLGTLRESMMYFKKPSELRVTWLDGQRRLSIGGFVAPGSIQMRADGVQFTLTDFKQDLDVIYDGVIPNLFKENQGIVVEATCTADYKCVAYRLMAKHDENYKPRAAS